MSEWRFVPAEPTEAMLVAGCRHENMGDMAGRYAAMLAAAPDGWQLIETAPRDTDILIGCWHANGTWWSETYRIAGEHWREDFDWYPRKPTHWHPLPSPPASLQEERR